MSWNRMPDEQPVIRIRMAVHHSKKGITIVDQSAGCRDFLRDHTEEHLWDLVDGSDGNFLTLDHPSCRKPEQNYMECGTFGDPHSLTDAFILSADVITGLVGVIISENRYVGNWCLTTPEDVNKHGARPGRVGVWLEEELPFTFRWYGIDNSPLMSPAMLYLTTGLFRQAVRLVELGLVEGLSGAVSREEVSRAMETSDKDLAWHLLQKAKPWVAGPGKRNILYLPLSGDRWNVMEGIYRAACAGTLMTSLGGSVEDSWGLRETSPYSDKSKDWRNISLKNSSWRKGLGREV